MNPAGEWALTHATSTFRAWEITQGMCVNLRNPYSIILYGHFIRVELR